MKKELRFTIINGAIPTELQHSPIGWDSLSVEVERSLETFGISWSYSTDLEFTKDGARLLRSAFYNFLKNDVYLTIDRFNYNTYEYEHQYTGKFDFETFEDNHKTVKVTVSGTNLAFIVKKYFDKKFDNRNIRDAEYKKVFLNVGWDCPLQMIKITSAIQYVLESMPDFVAKGYAIDMSVIEAIEAGESYPLITTMRAVTGYNMTDLGDDEFNYNGYWHRLGHLVLSFEDITQFLFSFYGISYSIVIVNGVETVKFTQASTTFPTTTFKTIENIGNLKISTAKEIIKGEAILGFDYEANESKFTYTVDGVGGTLQYDLKYELANSIKYDLNNKTSNNDVLDLRLAWSADHYRLLYKYFKDYEQEGANDDIYFTYVYDHEDGNTYIKHDSKTIIEPLQTFTSTAAKEITSRHILERLKWLLKSLTIAPVLTLNYREHSPPELSNFITDYDDEIPRPEFENVSVADNEHAFVPIAVEMDCVINDVDVIDMYDPANSLYEFNYNGETFKGYLIKAKVQPKLKNKTTITLLLSSDNDLTKLIR